jgi:hypothetical protein
MSDDGTGVGITIPALLIGKSDGQILKDFLVKSSTKQSSQIALSASFMVPHKSREVVVQLWYTSDDDRSLDFIKDLGEYIKPMVDRSALGLMHKVNFEPKFVHYACEYCDADYKR